VPPQESLHFPDPPAEIASRQYQVQPWVPPYDFYDGNDNFWKRYRREDHPFMFSVCLYYSVLVIGGNELGPKELTELIFMVIINLTGAIMQAYILGELAVLIGQVDRNGSAEQQVIDTANTAMANVKLSKKLRAQIRDYFKKVVATLSQQDELNSFLMLISPSLSLRVQSHMFEKVLKVNCIIGLTQNMITDGKSSDKSKIKGSGKEMQRRCESLLPCLVDKLGTFTNIPDQEVIKQDEIKEEEQDQDMFFIGKGNCQVKVRDQNGQDKLIRTLKEGDHFGEISMIYQCRRTATVISQNYNTFARIIRPRFRELISEFPEYEICLRQYIKDKYDDVKIEFLKNIVSSVEYLKNCGDDMIYDIIFSLHQETFEKDSIVLQANQPADKIYFLEEGQIELYTTFEGNDFVIEKLEKGSVLNHRAFFIQDCMYINVRCVTESKLLSLQQDTMKNLIQKYESIKVGRDLLIYQNKILK